MEDVRPRDRFDPERCGCAPCSARTTRSARAALRRVAQILYEDIVMESPEQWPIWIGAAAPNRTRARSRWPTSVRAAATLALSGVDRAAVPTYRTTSAFALWPPRSRYVAARID
eukprot:1221761-Prymnesium_polylepis.1